MDQDNGYFCVNSTANLTPAKTKDKDIEDKDLDKKWNALLLLTGVVTTIGCSLPVGYNIGVLNTPQGILKQWCNESIISSYNYHLDPAQLDILWSTIVSIFLIGGMIGSLAGSLLADKIGRKGALALGGTVGVLAACLFIGARFTSRVELMLLGRFLIGLSSGLTTGVMPMYLCEIAPTSLRAAMGVLCPLGLTFGVVFSQVMGLDWLLGTEHTWHYLLALYASLILLCGTVVPCLPESPKYLFQVKGLKQKAAKELARLRRQPVQNVMTELEGQTGKNQTEPWSVMRVITTSSLRLPLALVCALQFGQQTSGINAVFYYSIDIFKSAGLSQETAQYANLGAGVINFIIAVTMIPIVSQLPHRILTVTSCFLSTIMLFSLTICISYIEFFSWMAYMAIFSVLFYVLVYGLGLGPIPYFIGTELFEMGPRPAAMALGSVANWTGNFAVGMVFPLLQRFMGAYSFLIFAFFTALLTVFLKLCLPETNTKYRDSEAVPHATVQAPSHLPSTSQKKSERMLFQSIQDL